MNYKAVMIEAQPRGDIPVADVDLVLYVGGWLDVPAAVGELKLLLGIGIELRRISDEVTQRFVDGREERIDSRLPVVASVVAGQIGAGVAFAVAARLRDLHGSGGGIGSQFGAGIAQAAGQAEKQVGGNGVLEENLAAGFEIGDVLALARLLLDEFVGNQEAHGVVNQGDAQAIAT